LKNVEWR